MDKYYKDRVDFLEEKLYNLVRFEVVSTVLDEYCEKFNIPKKNRYSRIIKNIKEEMAKNVENIKNIKESIKKISNNNGFEEIKSKGSLVCELITP